MLRPLKAATVFSTKPGLVQRVGVDRDLRRRSLGDGQAAVDGGRRRAPVLVQLKAAGAGLHLLDRGRRAMRRCPCRRNPRFIGRGSAACSMRPMCQGPGVQVVALVPSAGPVPPPSMVVTPLIKRLLDLLRADEVDMRVDAAGGQDAALAGDRLGAGADDDVDAGLHVRVAGLADGGDAAVLDADIGLDDAPVVEDQRVGDHRVDSAVARGCLATGPCRRG